MKEIIGDDYPTYEDIINEYNKKHMKRRIMENIDGQEVVKMIDLAEQKIHKDNLERLMQENFELKHRLACIADDILIISYHIRGNCNKRFKRPSRNLDGSVHADEAWHNISNIEIACDLSDDASLEWTSDVNRV